MAATVAKSGSTGTKPLRVDAPLMSELRGVNSHHSVAAISTTGMGTLQRCLLQEASLAPATSLPTGSQGGTYLAVNMYRRQAGTALNLLGGAQGDQGAQGRSIFNENLDRHKPF